MRFKGTLLLMIVCAGFGAFLYFYEIKGGEQRDKAKQEENRLWKVESNAIQQIDLVLPAERISAVRTDEKSWKIVSPRELEADSDELNRIASSAAEINRESVLESNAASLARFGLDPPEVSLQFKTKEGKEHKIRFGSSNPTGSSTYACLEGKNEVLLVANYVASTFKKKLDDLRNRSILKFDQFETQSLDVVSEKGSIRIFKENDQWFFQGKERWTADSSGVNGILGSLSNTRVKEFLEEDADQFATLGFEAPLVDVKLTVGKDKGIKHLTVGLEKAKLARKGEKAPKDKKTAPDPAIYVARDESRRELFFVEKEFVDKLLKSPSELRDKTFASFKRWDIDVVVLQNSKGTFTFVKDSATSDWLLGDAKKKTKWDAVNGILDVLEKQVKSFVDAPGPAGTYGLESPAIRVVLKQGGVFKVDAAFGKETKDGIYGQVKGENAVKIVEKDTLEKLNKAEADFLEPPAPTTSPAPAEKK